VVEAQLFDPASADAVSSAVAHVGHPGTFGPEQESRPRGSHTSEVGVLLPAGVNAQVGLDESLAQSRRGPFVGVLRVGMWDDIHRQLAGQFSHRVRAHAVGHEEKMAPALPLVLIGRRQGRMIVLIVAAANANVRQDRVLDVVVTRHGLISPDSSPVVADCMLHGRHGLE
jgi:hypothetical protein